MFLVILKFFLKKRQRFFKLSPLWSSLVDLLSSRIEEKSHIFSNKVHVYFYLT